MPVTKQLYELQELDAEIERASQSLLQKTGQLGKRDVLDKAQAARNAEQEKLGELRKARKDTEVEVNDLVEKIKAAEKKLYDGSIKNPKELSNLQHDIAQMKGLNDPLENRTIEIIEQIEAADRNVKALETDYHKLEADWQQQQVQTAADIETLKKTLAARHEQRKQLTAQIDPAALTLYERVRRQKKPAVAKVEQGICRACRISLSASALQRARAGQTVQCGTCGRILFIS